MGLLIMHLLAGSPACVKFCKLGMLILHGLGILLDGALPELLPVLAAPKSTVTIPVLLSYPKHEF